MFEEITNLITTLSGNVRIFSTIINSTNPIKNDPIVIFFHAPFYSFSHYILYLNHIFFTTKNAFKILLFF